MKNKSINIILICAIVLVVIQAIVIMQFVSRKKNTTSSTTGPVITAPVPTEDVTQTPTESVEETSDIWRKQNITEQKIIEEMVVDYGSYGKKAEERVAELLAEYDTVSADSAKRWRAIMEIWQAGEDSFTLNYDVLPDGLPDDDSLCLVVLGFQLEEDGTMREELIERLKVAKRCAEKYPNALIVCTGGATATLNETATEAGRMSEWLTANGIAPERIIVEGASLTTAQNAIFTMEILERDYPQVKELAIISSDYHIETGKLLFEAEAILLSTSADAPIYTVSSNAAWKAPSGALSRMFQAGALIELSGDITTAFEIYYDTYDIHELPPLSEGDFNTSFAA